MSPSQTVSSRHFTSLFLWTVFGTVLGISASMVLKHTGDPADYFRFQVLPGQFLFILVKASGLSAMALLLFQVVLGLGRKALPTAMTIGQHKALGAATLLVIVFHLTAFVVAASMRNKIPTLDLLWPNFHGYYRTWLSVGLIGFWVLCLGIAAMLRGGAWRRLHWLMLVGFVLAYLHSLLVGSETRAGAMVYVYAAYAIAVLSTLAVRIRSAMASSSQRLTR